MWFECDDNNFKDHNRDHNAADNDANDDANDDADDANDDGRTAAFPGRCVSAAVFQCVGVAHGV